MPAVSLITNYNSWFLVLFHPSVWVPVFFSCIIWFLCFSAMISFCRPLFFLLCFVFVSLFFALLLIISTFSYPLTWIIERSFFFNARKIYKNVLRILKSLWRCYLPEDSLQLVLASWLKSDPSRVFSHCWKHHQKDIIIYLVKAGLRGARQIEGLIQNRIAAVCNWEKR